MIYNWKNHRPLPFASPGIWIAVLMLLMMAGRGWTQNLTEVEYYFDTDPGVGSGTSVSVIPPSSHLSNFNFSIDISGLNDGFHKLFVRAKDENEVWSFPNDRAFYKNTVTTPFYDLAKVEYFFDTDPGLGNGTNVPITPGPELSNLSFSIDITGLPSGFHHLFVRTKNQHGQWSFNSQRVFMKEFAAVPLPSVAGAEYFFDTDPGFGQGVSIPVSPGGSNVTLDFTVDLTSLPDGFHQLFARVKDSEGNWSLASTRAFYKHTAVPSNPQITEIEYFLDTDPGFGMATSVPVLPNSSNVTENFIVDLTSLSEGFHHLFVRAKDTEGNWSLTSSRSFIKQLVAPGSLSITRIEYFFDTDPGFGSGTSIPITPSTNVTVGSHIIDITSLTNGLHKLFVRAEDEAGTWSLTNQWVFYKNNYNAVLPNLVYAEYFFNTDPGLGFGIEIPVPGNSTQADLSFTTDLSGLNEGSNKLFVRMKDASGRWSHSVIHQIFKKTLPLDLPDIVYAEYFVDTDPGMGSGIQITVPNPGPDVTDLTFEVDLSQLIMGNHMLFLRTKDENGKWSLTLLDQFCHTPQADFSANDVWLGNTTTFTDLSYLTDPNTQYYWDVNGDNVTDYTYNHGFTHTYPATGTYNARLILVSPQGCPDTTIKQVSVFTCSQPTALWVSDTTENSAVLHWTPANIEPAWNIEYGFSGFTPGTGTLISNVTSNSHLLTGLATFTSYDFYVQSACYTGSTSNWAGPGSFVTSGGNFVGSPVAYYPFNGSANDVSGHNYHGSSVTASLTTDRFGTPNSAYYFNGSSSITIPFVAPFNANSHTICAWIQSNSSGGRIIAFPSGGGQHYSLNYGLPQTGKASIYFDGGGINVATSTSNINDNEWHFITGVIDGTNMTLRIYVDGELETTVPSNGNPMPGTEYLNIGRFNGYYGEYFTGKIDDVIIYNEVLSDAQIQNLYTPAALCINPADGGTIAADQTICFGTVPDPFTSITEATGHTGILEYKWQMSADNVAYQDIASSNSSGLAYGNALTATTWFRRLARVTCMPDWTGAASSDTIQISIEGRDRYRTKTSGDWDNIATWEYFNGTTWVDAVDFPSSTNIVCPNPMATVRNGHTINVDAAADFGNVTVDAGGILEVQNDVAFGIITGDTLTVNGTLIMHTTAVVNGAGHFRIVAGGTIHVGSSAGITVSNNVGNIQVTGSRTYYSGAHYVFTGTSNQFTGDALVQNTPGNISINAPGMVVTLSQAISINGNIHIIAGTLDVNNHNVTLGGNWTNDDLFIPGTGTVYFTSNVNVFISVSNFYHVVFAGSGTVTALGSLTVYGDLTINYQFDAGTFTHYVYGNWINNGVFIYGTSTIQFMGTANYYISISNFYNIIFAGSGIYTATGSLSIFGNITINNYFDAGAFTHYVYGNWINNGTFVQGTSTIQFSGSGNITIGATNFYNVVFACTGTVIASGQLTFYGNVTINNYFDAGSFVHYVYGNWINYGTFVYGTSTINFTGSSNIVIGGSNFYNVVFSGTGTISAGGSLVFYGSVNIITNFYAGSNIITVYGNWANTGIFDYGTSTVEFIGSGNITITQNDFYNVIFGGTGVFIATGSLNFYGNVTINSTFDGGSFVHYIYGNWINNGTFIYGTSTIYFTSTVNITIGASEFYNIVFGGTGTVTATGSLTIYGDVTINNYFDAGSFVHYVYGNWFNNGVFVYGTSTITFVGTVNLFISTNEFYNVVFAGTGTYTATGSITFYGSVTINNYFDAGAFIHYVYGNWTVNGTFVYGTSTIYFLGSGNILIGISNFYHIIFAGTGTITATGSLTIWGDVTINNYFDAGSFAHYVYGNWINNGIFVYGTSTIYFSATVNIYINTNEFYNVVFAGTGNYVATGSITFYGNVTINNYFDAGAFTHYVYGNWTVNGVFVYGTSTIHFLGTGISFVNAGNFYHVIFGGTGTVTATGSLTIYGNVNITGTFGGGSYIHYIYGNWTNTGTFVYGTSTIHFIGSGNILIGESDFYHIIFVGSGNIVATGSLSVYGDFTINTYFDAGAYEHYIYGNWYNYGIFVYGTSTIHFVGTGNIFLNPEEFYHVVFGGTGTVTATGTLIFHGNVTINNYFNAGAYVHYVYGNWTNNGTFVYGTSTIHFTGTGSILIGGSNFYHIIFGGTGTIAATGSLYVYGDVTINNYFDAGSYVHYIYGNWYNYGVFVYGTSTIHFSGSGNVYIGDYEFYHIIFGGTGTVVATGSLTIHGDVTINNYFDAGPYIHYVYGNWTNNGTFVYNTSTIRFVGAGSILIGAGNFYHVIFACSGTVTAMGTLYFYGNVTILNHFDAASYDHYVYGNWINNGTFVHGTSRIRFVGSQNLPLGTNNFYHVVFAKTGNITATGSLTIYGDLTITNHFDAGSYEHYIYGNWINNGIFVYSTSYIHFMGTVQQTISGSNETGYYRFRLNNPYGILLNRNVTVHYELILTEGIITTGTYVFIVMPSGTISGGSATAYIHGRLRCGYNAIGSRAFPVGTASSYGPMVLNYVTLTGTSMVDVEYIGGTIPGTIPANITSYADHYWVISQTGGINFTFTLTLNVTGFNPVGSVWMMRGDGFNISTVSTTAPNYTNFTVFDAFGDFTLGEVFCATPLGLINRYITYTEAILDWEPGDTELEWNVEYGPAGFTPGTGTMLSNVSTKPLTITGLTPESYYEFYVQSKCSQVVQSSWAGPEPFSTFPKQLDAKIFLEGPYDENSDVMETNLRTSGLLPLTQPYQGSPWNYSGDEQVATIPPGVVDWILLEWRDASAPSLAISSTYIWRKAAFLKADGAIVDLDGSNLPWIGNPQLSGSLYIIVYHRNHLSVISNYGAVLLDELYEYDFSDQLNKAYGGTTGYKQIGSSPLRFGMVSGDGDANGSINLNQDIDGIWNTDAGKKGYLLGDYDLNGQVQNQDKNDTWKPNLGKTSSVP